MSILIKNVLLDGSETDILIEGKKIKKISKRIKATAKKTIEAKGMAIIPSFINGHTHSAMTLLRGYADDMPLNEWLEKKIWPIENKLTPEQVYWGVRLACLEMIKTGTTFFNDMYWHYEATAKAVEDSGLRASLSEVLIDFFDDNKLKEQIKINEKLIKTSKKYKNITHSIGPHSIYTLSKKGFEFARHFSKKNKLLMHMHLSETEEETKICVEKEGMRPVEYLESIGILGENLLAAHSVWLDDNEIKLIKEKNVALIYNPTSNMKLSSKGPFNYPKLQDVKVILGTDGCSSNNNLDMFEEMKFASLLQKEHHKPTTLSAEQILDIATKKGADVFSLDSGLIKEGADADLILVNLKVPEMVPCYNLTSNIVYSANGSCVDTTICQGNILMENRIVKDEKKNN